MSLLRGAAKISAIAFGIVAVAVAIVYVAEYLFSDEPDSSQSGQESTSVEERTARRGVKHAQQQLVPPHSTNTANPAHQPVSTHEKKDLDTATTDNGSSTTAVPPTLGLRNECQNADVPRSEDLAAPRLMDVPNGDDIPFVPLAPEHNPWSGVQTSRSPTLSPSLSSLELGSESATLPSASPKSRDISLSVSRASSPIEASPRVQLPTPSESDMMAPSSPETHPDLLESTSVSPLMSLHIQLPTPFTSDAPLPQTLSPEPHPDLSAPSMSRTVTDASASFISAQSPTSEFRSFPPSELISPVSESFVLSDDEDMLSHGSHSSDSIPVFASEEDHHGGLSFVVGNTTEQDGLDELSDSSSDSSGDSSGGGSSDSSDKSWVHDFNEPRSGATSPRY